MAGAAVGALGADEAAGRLGLAAADSAAAAHGVGGGGPVADTLAAGIPAVAAAAGTAVAGTAVAAADSSVAGMRQWSLTSSSMETAKMINE